ncbi:MAG: hypothetical protein U9Q40_00525 [Campylobacterota bacterium]|nr:hypothetical protein [Campylobacterota bacterium]
MNNNSEAVTVNKKQAYHNCEMTFCFYYESAKSDFKVTKKQKYKIYTTAKELELLNEALNIFQAEGFKDAYLLYTQEVDGSQKYPEFVMKYTDSVNIAKALQSAANDEDSLTQLSEYCLEIAPTYEDDFRINKQIDSVTIDTQTREVKGYSDLKEYLLKQAINN